jgi:hypothetical protein
VDTYPREYNEFEMGLLSITSVIFLYANEKMFFIILAQILFIDKFYVLATFYHGSRLRYLATKDK